MKRQPCCDSWRVKDNHKRHVIFFKKLSPEFEVTSDSVTNRDTDVPETVSRSVPLTPPPTPKKPLEDLLPPVQQENDREGLAFRALSTETPTAIPHDPQSGTGMEPASQVSEAVGEEGRQQTYVGTQKQNRGNGGEPHLQTRQQRIYRPLARYRDENFEYVQK